MTTGPDQTGFMVKDGSRACLVAWSEAADLTRQPAVTALAGRRERLEIGPPDEPA
ncbi:MAG: hypothetical protein H0V73_03945 [Chloroflexi bacterium]|nr:hypothetical protein [Chloroflexota bacterium]